MNTHCLRTVAMLAVLLAAGCARTRDARHFLIEGAPVGDTAAMTGADPFVVGPVYVPDYLHKPQIATRGTSGEVLYDEFSRWAEIPETAVPRALVANLARILGNPNVYLSDGGVRYPDAGRVRIDIRRFDVDSHGAGSLEAVWDVERRPGGPVLYGQSSLACPKTGSGPDDVVAGYNKLVELLAADIAAALRNP